MVEGSAENQTVMYNTNAKYDGYDTASMGNLKERYSTGRTSHNFSTARRVISTIVAGSS